TLWERFRDLGVSSSSLALLFGVLYLLATLLPGRLLCLLPGLLLPLASPLPFTLRVFRLFERTSESEGSSRSASSSPEASFALFISLSGVEDLVEERPAR